MADNLAAAIKVAIPSIKASPNGFEADDADLTCLQNGKDALKNLLVHFDLMLDKKTAFAAGQALLTCSGNVDGKLAFSNNDLHTITLDVLRLMEDVKKRYGLAFKSQSPIERTPIERHVLTFNKSAFALLQRKGHYVFLPDTSSEQQYIPVDPRSLNCPEPVDSKMLHIENAIVTGARDADGGQMQLPYNGNVEIKVLISLQHGVAEVLHTMTFDEAQGCWKKVNRMTADVLVESGKISRVIGTPKFVREEGAE